MHGSRSVLRLSVAAIFVLILAVDGWTQGPRDPWQLAGIDGPAFTVGGGTSRWTVIEGENGRAPGGDLSLLGLNNGFTNAGRLRFDLAEMQGTHFALTWDHYFSLLTGSSYYHGPPHPVIGQGDTTDTQVFVILNAVSLDANAAWMAAPRGWLKGGPRLQFTSYQDRVQVSVSEAGRDVTDSKNSSMLGLGVWGSLDLAAMTGSAWESNYAVIRPQLSAAAAYGSGKGLSYSEWEAFLQVFLTPRVPYTWKSVTVGPLAVDIGYVKYYFNENVQPAGLPAGDFRMRLGMPLVRASLSLSF